MQTWLNLALGYHNCRARICDKEQGLVGLGDSLGTGADHSRCRWVNQGHIHSLAAILGTDDLCHPFWPGLAQQLPCKEEREKKKNPSGNRSKRVGLVYTEKYSPFKVGKGGRRPAVRK